ncbi:hypothetical protein GCM10010911_17710 [Paenibacillus nasutitermitis]|uniref:Uncharacterized protein n=1 Tax=Paenibacillus nasutitermitis TaxID=1652958 RepID=A0A916YTM2_9BACL|nr:hypothetical protein GCM10010911_17710 [Paenibacillus nasutitermitis]
MNSHVLLRIIPGVLLLIPIVLSVIHKKWVPGFIFLAGYLFGLKRRLFQKGDVNVR